MAASPTVVLNHVSLIEHWYLSKPLGSDAATTKVKLYWEDANLSGVYKFDSLTVARWNGSAWEDANCYSSCPSDWISSQPERTYTGSAIGSGAGTIRSNTVSSFSPFTLASIGVYQPNPLPIELTNFTVKLAQHTAAIKWTTSSEINNDYFTIERSRNGVDFTPLMNVSSQAANGNSTSALYYSAKDAMPYNGISYYRLKQTDLDGKFSYSKVVAIDNALNESLTVYPNPAKNEVRILVPGITTSTSTRLQVVDVTGKVLMEKTQTIGEDTNEIRLSLSDLGNGVYFISLKTATQNFNQRIIKQ
jgi:hypothetical protein